MDFAGVMDLVKNMLPSSVVTLEIFFLTIIFSSILGMFVAFGRMSKYAIIRIPIQVFLLIMRGTPLILQLMFFYFAPYYIFAATLPRFWAAILAFTLNYSAYIAEIYRSGIESIPVGQYEAATVLGFGKAETFFNKCYDGTLTEEDFSFEKIGHSEEQTKGAVRDKIRVLPDIGSIFSQNSVVEEEKRVDHAPILTYN